MLSSSPIAAHSRSKNLSPGLVLLIALLFASGVLAQSPASKEWTWMGGSDTTNQSGVYGTLGTPAAGNVPGSRIAAASWTDNNGNFWLFGGLGYDSAGNQVILNDVWEFSPSTNEWAWMGGGSIGDQSGTYGTLGTPAAGNTPGGRWEASSWTDSSGNLWLFGGENHVASGFFPFYNDLWKFDPLTDEWTWMGGSSVENQPGRYGMLTMPAAGNIPGARVSATSWTDGSGNLWLFGGWGLASAADSVSTLNDLWEFSPSKNEWTWMAGSSDFNGLGAVCGTLGTPAARNTPGPRVYASSWTDLYGHLWLFGGNGYDCDGSGGDLNDLWEFNPSKNEWAWMAGAGLIDCQSAQCTPLGGVYGQLGTPAAGNNPGVRSAALSWTDSSGNFWLFGGGDSEGLLDDLWKFYPLTNEWAWMAGPSTTSCRPGFYYCGQPGVYGTLGSPSTGNIPGGRWEAAGWIDGSGNLWLFGGKILDANNTYGYLNDLWEYKLPSVFLSLPSLSFGNVKVGTVSASRSATLTNSGDASLPITRVSVIGADASSFVFGNNCGTSLAAGASCTIHGHFAPTTVGPMSAAITVTDSATNSPQTLTLSGTGADAPPTLSATNLSFGSVKIGAISASQSVTLTNSATAALPISSIAVTGANAASFVFANSCGTSLAAGASCTIHGHFAPVAAGALTAAITITDDATNSPQSITLTGTGILPPPTLSATALSFGTVKVGTVSASQSVTLTNTSPAALAITSITLTGAGANSFVFANSCGESLAAGASCAIHGHFAPTAAGAASAAITITDDASNSPQSIALTGAGQ